MRVAAEMETKKRAIWSPVQNTDSDAKTRLLQRIKAWKTEEYRARLRWLGYFCVLFLLLPCFTILREPLGEENGIGSAIGLHVLQVLICGVLLGLELLAGQNRRMAQRELIQQLEAISDQKLLPALISSLDATHPKLNHLLIQTLKRFLADTSQELSGLVSADWEQLCSHLSLFLSEGEFEMVHLILQRLPTPASPRVVSALADFLASDALWPLDILWEETQESLDRLLTFFDFRFGLPLSEVVEQWIQQLPFPYLDDGFFATTYSLQADAVIEPRHMGLAYLALGKLLPQLSTEMFRQLSKYHRATLYWNLLGSPVASNETSLHLARLGPQYAHAVLDKIAQAGDLDALAYLNRFVHHGMLQEWVPKEIRQKAMQTLLELEEQAKREEAERLLLRASVPPPFPKEELLRPILKEDRSQREKHLLLRGVPIACANENESQHS